MPRVRSRYRLDGRIFCLTLLAFGLFIPNLAWTETPSTAAAPQTPPDEKIYGIEPSVEQRQHWSFLPLKSITPPATGSSREWVRNSIDSFIWDKLNSNGLQPSVPAEPRVWLRRVYFDLIGLPPPPREMQEFLADPSDAARERVVEKLLADPGYGVRWGRKWLDVVRYGDTNGYERDGNKPSAWRYRDYVIDSLNADKPFDRFLTEQIAGDEIDQPTAESMTATSFLRLGTWDDEPADPVVDRYDQLDDVVRAVSTTFLGLTVNCARCHNHKFEPLSQMDYARLLAVFAPLERPQEGRTEFDREVGTPHEVENFKTAKERADTALKHVQAQLQALQKAIQHRVLADRSNGLADDARAAFLADGKLDETQRKLRKTHQEKFDQILLAAYSPDEKRQKESFQAAVTALQAAQPTPLPKAYIFQEQAGKVPATQVFRRGDPSTPSGCVEPGIPVVMAPSPVLTVLPPKATQTSGRRLALARWMIDSSQNALVPRVIVNRIWQGHFGEGLVRSENDFGVMSSGPSHPELLDWLAAELLKSGWKLKELHRQIVLSQTYAQASARRDDAGKIDPSNTYLWRFPYQRLDAEPIRDAILAANGTLNLKQGGPGIYPKLGAEVLASQSRPGNGWGTSSPDEAARRTAYIFVKRSLIVPFMELMDLPDTTTACEQRNVSTIPTQSLTLMNSDFMQDQAKLFAERLKREAGADAAAQITLAYQLALARAPAADELEQASKFLQSRQVSKNSMEAAQALPALCLVLYNLNEFFYID
ncbi:MAG: hypothetical protein JWM11_7529 [Planctomycetaceae bacterium]|nr:hypothetical protein [Planctomycetaceae bacterium]